MGNRLGTNLSRLIRERAYLAGTLPQLQERAASLRAQSRSINAALRTANARMSELDAAITTLSAIEPADIRPIKSMSRVTSGKHGEFRRELVRVLKEAGGAVELDSLIRHMATAFELSMETPKDRRRASYLVRRPLYVFRKQGAVRRLPDHPITDDAVWAWVD